MASRTAADASFTRSPQRSTTPSTSNVPARSNSPPSSVFSAAPSAPAPSAADGSNSSASCSASRAASSRADAARPFRRLTAGSVPPAASVASCRSRRKRWTARLRSARACPTGLRPGPRARATASTSGLSSQRNPAHALSTSAAVASAVAAATSASPSSTDAATFCASRAVSRAARVLFMPRWMEVARRSTCSASAAPPALRAACTARFITRAPCSTSPASWYALLHCQMAACVAGEAGPIACSQMSTTRSHRDAASAAWPLFASSVAFWAS
mmetsp:Transcript_24162/g.83874  ORF Transcript_24162/g.83874 Transcript_24162/m.83874 type:complete len:272 (+) Transcript_24162:1274-2089(+)